MLVMPAIMLKLIQMGLILIHCSMATVPDDIIVEAYSKLCPKVDICDRNATSAKLRPKGRLDEYNRVSCCFGCSCHPDCKGNMNCCYEDDYWPKDDDVTYPVCTNMFVAPLNGKREVDSTAYYTISTAPSGGCTDDRPFQTISGDTLTPSCGSNPVAYWGDIYPVLDTRSKDIYKNEACARCHGVSEYEEFRAYLVCDKFKTRQLISLAEHTQMFKRRILSPHCIVRFDYQDASLLRPKLCSLNPTATCSRNKASLLVNVTFDEIQAECENGVYSPVQLYAIWYRNMFCVLCNVPITDVVKCSEDTKGRYVDATEIIMLLDMRNTEPTTPGDKVTPPEVCLKDTVAEGETICRLIHCPVGMTYNREGVCVFISKTWITTGFYLHIMLTPVGGHINVSFDDHTSLIKDIFHNSPWSAQWSMTSALVKEQDGLRESEGMFTMYLLFDEDTYSVESFVNDIKQRMSEILETRITDSLLQFKQSLCDYDLRNVFNDGEVYPLWARYVNENDDLITKEDAAVWRKIPHTFTYNDHRVWYVFNRLFLCEQVDLHSDEFDAVVEGYLIKNKLNGRYMFNQEFVMMADETGSRVARVCLSDTPFVTTTSGSGVVSSWTSPIELLAIFAICTWLCDAIY